MTKINTDISQFLAIECRYGNDLNFTVTFLQSDLHYNVDSFTHEIEVFDRNGDERDIFQLGNGFAVVDNVVTFSKTDTQIEAIGKGRYKFKWHITNDSGKRQTWFNGTFTISERFEDSNPTTNQTIIVSPDGANVNVDISVLNLTSSQLDAIANLSNNGIIDYNDTTTSVTPIAVTPDTWVNLTNDGLGAFTNKAYPPSGVTDLWNVNTNKFDFSQLSLGDWLIIRVDASITINTNNTVIYFRLNLAEGGSPYQLVFGSQYFKDSGTYRVVANHPVYIGDNNTKNNPASLQFSMDSSGSVVHNGFAIMVTKR